MRRLLLACLALLISVPAIAGVTQFDYKGLDFNDIRDRLHSVRAAKGIPLPPPLTGFDMHVGLVGINVLGGGSTATFQVFWRGPGFYSIYGGCPAGNGQCTNGQYSPSELILPPGGIGILTHTGIFTPGGFPSTTFTTPGGNLTTLSTTVATSQPNNLHAFFVLRYEDDGTYPVFFSTSVPGQIVIGPGRNYVATIEVPGLRGGRHVASAMQRLLHYTTTAVGTSTYLTVGGSTDNDPTSTYRYLIDYEYFDVNVIIPTTSSYGLVALGMILVGAGLLFMRRRRTQLPVA